jgi:hypothetical protein
MSYQASIYRTQKDTSGNQQEVLKDSSALVLGTDLDVTVTFDGTKLTYTLLTDDTVIEYGDGTNSPDIKWFGNIPTAFVYWDASANEFQMKGPARPRGLNAPSPRYELAWTAGARGKPALNAVIALDENSNAAAHLAANLADRQFEVLGVNATTALVTFYVEGGLLLTTAGADGDEMILVPHLDTNQSAWNVVTWGTDQEVVWQAHVKTAASVANFIAWAGLKLTNTEVKATDDNQVYFRVEDDVTTAHWELVWSIAGVDVSTDTAVTVAANTEYHLVITIDSARIARGYINGVLVATTTALADAIDLIPYIGVAADGAGAAKALRVMGQAISRKVA